MDDTGLSGVPTPARAPIPPEDYFDPLELDILKTELETELEGRERFGRFSELQLFGISKLFIRYGFFSIKDIKRAQEKARNCFVDDLRRKENVSFFARPIHPSYFRPPHSREHPEQQRKKGPID